MTDVFSKSYTIECDNGCGSPVVACTETRMTVFGTMRKALVCQGCGFIQSDETTKAVLHPKYKPPILHYHSGWIFSDDPDYELWKNILSHDCKTGEGMHLVKIDNNYFFRENIND